MPRIVQSHSGSWWRFGKYGIVDGLIGPVDSAALEQYSPWDEYRDSKGKTRDQPSYQELLSLTRSLDARMKDIVQWVDEDSLDQAKWPTINCSVSDADKSAVVHFAIDMVFSESCHNKLYKCGLSLSVWMLASVKRIGTTLKLNTPA